MSYRDISYRVECYRPTDSATNEHSFELLRAAQSALEKTRVKVLRILSIAIDISVPFDPKLRRELVAAVGRAVRSIDSADSGQAGTLPVVLTHGPGVTISVVPGSATAPGTPPILPRHPDFPQKGNDFTTFVRIGIIDAVKASGVQGGITTGVGTSCVGIWAVPDESAAVRPPLDPAKLLERRGRKIEKKIIQSRSTDGSSRIVVTDAWEVDHLSAAGPEAAERMRGKLIRAHEGVAAILLTHRRRDDTRGRYCFTLCLYSLATTPPRASASCCQTLRRSSWLESTPKQVTGKRLHGSIGLALSLDLCGQRIVLYVFDSLQELYCRNGI